jgi:nitrogen fixation/metabolism regulation signal transduction histidine kinase
MHRRRRTRRDEVEEMVSATDHITQALDRQHEREREEAERRLAYVEALLRALRARLPRAG